MFDLRGSSDLVLPVEDDTLIDKFRRDFRVRRKKEPGLSVVVPYCRNEITPRDVLQAVCREYFCPILRGTLVMEVEGPDTNVRIDQNNILDQTEHDDSDLDGDVKALVAFAADALALPAGRITRLADPPADAPFDWGRRFLAEVLADLAERFENGHVVALSVPARVTYKAGNEQVSCFTVFLRRDREGRGHRPVFVREGIVIPRPSGREPGVAEARLADAGRPLSRAAGGKRSAGEGYGYRAGPEAPADATVAGSQTAALPQ